MRFRAGFPLSLAVLASLLLACVVHAATPPSPAAFAPDEVLIKFRPTATARATAAITEALGADRLRTLDPIGVQVLRVPTGTVQSAIDRYRGDPSVEYVEPNYRWHVSAIPNDPYFPNLWGMQNTGQTGGTPGADIRAPQAWSVFTGSASVLVGIVDTGIDYTHPDLAANVWTNPGEIPGNGIDDDNNGYVDDLHGWDFINHDNDPMDDNGHGTHVSGTVAGVGNNGIGVAGVCWTARLVALKFLDSGGFGSTDDAIAAINYAAANGVRVINASWGGGGYSQALHDAIEAAGIAGVVFVAAAGNNASDTDAFPNYPSAYDLPSIVAVAASTHNDVLAGFSNWGATTVDLAAPGENIFSTFPGNSYTVFSGTSMATPHVAGALALLIGRFPNLTVAGAKAQLLAHVHPLASLTGKVLTGGRLDAFGAISDPDTIPPGAVTDLHVTDVQGDHVTLAWTATGDDFGAGTAFAYDVRYSSAPIDAGNFAAATHAGGTPEPGPSGTAQQMVVHGLTFSHAWYFAMKVSDESGNVSALSNPATAVTLGPPDVAVSPDSLSAELLTGQSAARTLTVSNLGVSALDVRAEIEGAPGLSVQVSVTPGTAGAAVLGTATPVPLARIGAGAPVARRIRLGAQASAPVDRGAGSRPGWGSGYLLLSANQEVFGGRDNGFFAGPRTRGNLFQCTTGRLLREHRFYLQPGPGTHLWFVVYEGAASSGSFTLVSASRTDPTSTAEGWYSSGKVDVPLVAGRYYLIAATWDQPSAYFNRLSIAPYPIPATFGALTAGVGWTWAPDPSLPPVPQIAVPTDVYNSDAVAYYQTLITDDLTRWLSVTPDTSSVPAGQSLDLGVTFDASGLDGGDYLARIALTTNDPDEPVVHVGARLHVTGAADIALEPAQLEFDSLFVGATRVESLTVRNAGTDLLTITGIDVTPPVFGVPAGGFTLAPHAQRALPVTFHPLSAGSIPGQVAVHSDDPDEPVVVATLHGVALDPPDIALSPDSLSADLITGQTSSATLTLANTGVAELDWHLRVHPTAATLSAAGGPPAVTERTMLGTVAAGEPSNAPAVARLAERVRYGPASAPTRILVYADDPVRPPGQQDVDLALQALGLPYTAVYYNPDAFGAALVAGGWDLVIVDHETYYGLGQWWSEMEAFLKGGGRLLVSTFDVDGSNSEPTTLWTTVGLRPAEDVSNTLPPVAWWDAAHPIFTQPGTVPPLASFTNYFFDEGDKVGALSGTATAGFTAGPAPAQGAIIVSQDENAIVNSFIVPLGDQDADFDGTNDAVELLRNEIAFLAGSVPWLSVAPRSGRLPAGSSLPLAVTFDASGQFGGDYRAEIVVHSNDPDEVDVAVPAHLHVTGAPDIALLGAERSVSSTMSYGMSGASTVHHLPFSGPVAGGATLRLRVDGDYGNSGETATAIAEGVPLGATGEDGTDCSADSAAFVIDPAQLGALIADGMVNVVVQNSPDVDVFCSVNQHTVTLAWRRPADSLNVGVPFIGQCRAETLSIANRGTDTLIVSALTTGDPRFAVTPATLHIGPLTTAQAFVSFCPTGPGFVRTDLTVLSNDPDAPALTVHLSGTGVAPPDIAVATDTLYAELGPNEVADRHVDIGNSGQGPLLWNARTLENATTGPAGASGASFGAAGGRGPRGVAVTRIVPGHGADPQALPVPIPVPEPGAASLEHVRSTLDSGHESIADLVPARFAFTEGDSGIAIADGGANMYDGGNQLQTAYGGWLPYTEGAIGPHPLLGPNGRYFTRKYPGLFVVAADLDNVTMFGTDGDLGADGYGQANGTSFTFTSAGQPFQAFVKRVWGAPVPSVNHVIIVPGNTETGQDFANYTNSDYHLVYGIPGGRVYYLLFASQNGGYVDDLAMRAIAQRFMDVVQLGSGRLALDASAGGVPAGSSSGLGVHFRTAGLLAGTYDTDILVASNDPDEPMVRVPTRLHVLGRPDIAVAPDSLDFGAFFTGLARTDSAWVTNTGTDVLTVSGIDVSPSMFLASGGAFSLAPGVSRPVSVTFAPVAPGAFTGTLVVHSDDPDHPDSIVRLRGTGLVPPDVAVRPDSLFAELGPNAQLDLPLTVANHGGSPLEWAIGAGFTLAAARSSALASGAETSVRAATHGPVVRPPAPTGAGGLAALVQARIGALPPTSVVFHDDMEHGPGGWTTMRDGLDDLWHQTTRAWNSPNHSWWCGIEATGDYNTGNAIRNGLVSPPIDLRGAVSPATLEFAETFETEFGWDQCGVQVRGDQDSMWFALRPPPTGSSGGWRLTSLDLSPWVGHVVRIRFYFDTVDGIGNNFPGWFVDDVTVTSAAPPWLTVTPPAGTVAAGDSVPVNVGFTSAGLLGGNFDAVLGLTSNDPDQPLVRIPARLHVLGIPDIALTPALLDFGTVYTGAARVDSIQVRNAGTDLLTVTGVTASPAAFTPDATGFTLAPGAARRVAVTFHPGSVGTFTGTLVVHSDDPDHPSALVSLTGAGLEAPDIAVHPDSLFAELGVNATVVETLVVANRGGSPLNWNADTGPFAVSALDDAAPGGADPGGGGHGPLPIRRRIPAALVPASRILAPAAPTTVSWILLTPPFGSVAAGDSAAIQVRFSSGFLSGGHYHAVVLITSNDPDHPLARVGTDLHVLGQPDIVVFPTAIDFGTAFVGFPRSDSVWVANNGTDDLIVSGLTPSPAAFSVTDSAFVVPRGSSRSVRVTFTPGAVGPITGTLVIHSNDADQPNWSVPLSGAGVLAPDIAVNPDSIAVALGAGQTVMRSLTLSNTGGSGLDWRIQPGYSLAPASAARPARAAPAAGERRSGAGVTAATGSGGIAPLVQARLATLPPGGIVFYDDMEHGTNGWTKVAYTPDDLWHPTTHAWSSADHSWWCASESTGTYATGRAVRNGLVSPPIDLRNVTAPLTLGFAENYETEPGYDECSVWVRADSSAAWELVRWPVSGSSGGWQLTNVDLSAYKGLVVRIQFLFWARDGINNNYPGWFVDDVLVTSDEPPWLSVAPRSGTIAPGASAPTQVTVSSTGLPAGAYRAVLTVLSNDPDEPAVGVPVTLGVGVAVAGLEAPPVEFALAPVRPNVARGAATIEFDLPRPGRAQAAIYDVAGRRMHVIAEGALPAGRHRYIWRGESDGGSRAPAGVYLLRLEAADGRRTRRFVWMP
jgi:subtilisin family serine protease